MKYFCNPLNVSYKYQFNKSPEGKIIPSREGADPSLVAFKGKYILFPSMTCGFLYSDDLVTWEFHATPMLPNYDYAPDVRVVGEYLYYCASNHEHGVHYKTSDPFSDSWERIEGGMPFWDPNLFCDDDGRLYFYWGSSTSEPIYGVELDKNTMQPIGERVALITCDPTIKGFERSGEDHIPPRSKEEVDAILAQMEHSPMSEEMKKVAASYIRSDPYIEGVWMTKKGGRYYLQYATPSSGYNIYSDAVYVSDKPLEGFTLALNNPFSYKPGGFFPGAGHGSTVEDFFGNWWHIATGRICVNHNFERRVGLYPVGFDKDGEMFCNQRFGDFPIAVLENSQDPWRKPDFMLLSYGKRASASTEERAASFAVDEDIRTFWQAKANDLTPYLEVDLGKAFDVNAIQINFADLGMEVELPENATLCGALHQERWIDETHQPTRWRLLGSVDGENYFVIEDKSGVDTDLSHDLVLCEAAVKARYVKLEVVALPYGQSACVSGLRVFGKGNGEAPTAVCDIAVEVLGELDVNVSWTGNAVGYNVVWGYTPDKLYHCNQTFGREVTLKGLIKGQSLYVRVDSFNESGITEGEKVIKVK